tara:strand:- start:371 stop:553 length:183 start_codon:yes stop_codon:yes gene_type:complete
MKPTNRNIGKYFDLAPETLSKYNNGKNGLKKKRLYDALKIAFILNETIKNIEEFKGKSNE